MNHIIERGYPFLSTRARNVLQNEWLDDQNSLTYSLPKEWRPSLDFLLSLKAKPKWFWTMVPNMGKVTAQEIKDFIEAAETE